MPLPVVVIPCYNEALRLDAGAFLRFLEGPGAGYRFLFVNDGSVDGTASVLDGMARRCRRVKVLTFKTNQGKAEAVRRGLLEALRDAPEWVAFLDADLATPLEALSRFEGILLEHPEVDLVMGSRVRLLGRTIRRNGWRHYLGRVFATLTSLMLRLPVYDTQCGAKVFRATPRLARVLEEPFLTRWIFDVEILLRFLREYRRDPPSSEDRALVEVPLQRWEDVRGSKVRPWDFVTAAMEMATLYWRVARMIPPPHSSDDSTAAGSRD